MLPILALIASAGAYAGLFGFGGDSWKEEVLLHDGRKIIVERSQTYGGSHEIGQASSVKTHSIRFTQPLSGQTITWESEYSKELGRTNFNVLALHILDDIPYLITEPNLCLSYNKWGRPNPPYVIFEYDGRSWQRIEMANLPAAFEKINLIVNNGRIDSIKAAAHATGYVSVKAIDDFNSSLSSPEYMRILREGGQAIKNGCIHTDYYPNVGWLSPDWFSEQPSLDACFMFCKHKAIGGDFCPCKRLMKERIPER